MISIPADTDPPRLRYWTGTDLMRWVWMNEMIDVAYHSLNIYQSIILCPERYIGLLFREMKEKDYPVSRVEDVAGFHEARTRVLLATPEEWNPIHHMNERITHIFSLCGPFEESMTETQAENFALSMGFCSILPSDIAIYWADDNYVWKCNSDSNEPLDDFIE